MADGSLELDYRCGGSVGIGLLRTDFPFYPAACAAGHLTWDEACMVSALRVKPGTVVASDV